jgi:drug/metabolite transporter (DMT)-like permease
MLVSAVAIAFYYIWSAELTEKYGTLPVSAWNALAGLIAILPLSGWELAHMPVQITTQAVWAVVYLGVMVTVAGLRCRQRSASVPQTYQTRPMDGLGWASA